MIKLNIFTMSIMLLASNISSATPNPDQTALNTPPANVQPKVVQNPPMPLPSPASALSVLAPKKNPNAPVSAKSDNYVDAEVNVDKKDEYQEIIDAYKTYLTTVSKETIEEVRAYRLEMVKINKKKKALYKSLSGEAQSYLAHEAGMKRKLPVNKRKFSE